MGSSSPFRATKHEKQATTDCQGKCQLARSARNPARVQWGRRRGRSSAIRFTHTHTHTSNHTQRTLRLQVVEGVQQDRVVDVVVAIILHVTVSGLETQQTHTQRCLCVPRGCPPAPSSSSVILARTSQGKAKVKTEKASTDFVYSHAGTNSSPDEPDNKQSAKHRIMAKRNGCEVIGPHGTQRATRHLFQRLGLGVRKSSCCS